MSVPMSRPHGQINLPSRSWTSNRLLILALWQRSTLPGPTFLYFHNLALQPEHLMVSTKLRFRRTLRGEKDVGRNGKVGLFSASQEPKETSTTSEPSLVVKGMDRIGDEVIWLISCPLPMITVGVEALRVMPSFTKS